MWTQRKLAILGASRGLGAEISKMAHKYIPAGQLMLSSRKSDLLRKLSRDADSVIPADFTMEFDQKMVFSQLESFKPTDIIYVAGGGPYGEFAKKQVKDHLWAMELNLIFPLKLIHFIFSSSEISKNIKNLIVVGSAIAESQPDALASSYAAAKHGLKGLVTSIQVESPHLPLKLYSPGYMDTEMLPKNAKPRSLGVVSAPKDEAEKLWKLL
jgi:short-subunit dehydrogenase